MRRLLIGLTLASLGCGAPASVDAGHGDDAGEGMDAGIAQEDAGGGDAALCDALAGFITRCGGTPCDGALRAGCASLSAALDPGFVASVSACLSTDNPTNCFFDALMAATPGPAQERFRDAYCAGCRADDPSCAASFFGGGDAALALVLAASEATAAELEARCTSGAACGAGAGACAEQTLDRLGVPTASASCFVDTLLAENALPAGCGGEPIDGGTPDGGSPDGGAPPGDGGGVGDGGAASDGGAGADGGAGSAACAANEPNEDSESAQSLGAITDRTRYPAGTVSAGIDSDADEDWFTFHDDDRVGGFVRPRADLTITAGGNLDLCVYFDCDSAGATVITCTSGSPATAGALNGCCSTETTPTEQAKLEPECSGADDSGTVFVRVYAGGPIAMCAPYRLTWGDD